MLILSIESSCDETAAAVTEDGRRILSNVVYTQIAEHRKYGGVVPEIASRRHVEHICGVTEQALKEAGVSLAEVDAVGVTAWPGLIGALLVGVNYAKGLALASGKPLVPVHHLRGHVAANYLAHPELEPPFLALIVSGGHSHICDVSGYTGYRILARTRDDAAGEAFDKAARVMGYPYPGGVSIDRAAQRGDPDAFVFPRPAVGDTLDFSFSGLKTAVINTIHNLRQKGELGGSGEGIPDPDSRDGRLLADIAASFEGTVCDILVSHTREAIRRTGRRTLAVAGGVSANAGLRAALETMCREEGVSLCLPPLSLCGDNAAMIGSQAYYEYLAGIRAGADLNASATMSVE